MQKAYSNSAKRNLGVLPVAAIIYGVITVSGLIINWAKKNKAKKEAQKIEDRVNMVVSMLDPGANHSPGNYVFNATDISNWNNTRDDQGWLPPRVARVVINQGLDMLPSAQRIELIYSYMQDWAKSHVSIKGSFDWVSGSNYNASPYLGFHSTTEFAFTKQFVLGNDHKNDFSKGYAYTSIERDTVIRVISSNKAVHGDHRVVRISGEDQTDINFFTVDTLFDEQMRNSSGTWEIMSGSSVTPSMNTQIISTASLGRLAAPLLITSAVGLAMYRKRKPSMAEILIFGGVGLTGTVLWYRNYDKIKQTLHL